MENEVKDYLTLFIEDFGDRAIEKISEKFYRMHRGNTLNILRQWTEELGKIKYVKDKNEA
jgi:hypothetical protein